MNQVWPIGCWRHVRGRLVAWCCMVVMLLFTTTGLSAQNNEYGINDELYELYMKSYDNRKTYLGMQMAQTMYKRAVEMGDRRGQCYALEALLQCESQKVLNDKAVNDALARLQRLSSQIGCWDLYHHAPFFKCYYLLRGHRRLEALHYAEGTLTEAKAHNCPLDIYNAYCNVGLVRHYRNEYHHSMDAYNNAIKYAQKYLPDMDLGNNYVHVVFCYDGLLMPKEMLEAALKGKSVTSSPESRVRLQRAICRAYYLLGKKEEFKKAYTELQGMGLRDISLDHEHDDDFIDVFNCLLNKDYATAKAILDKLPSGGYYKNGVLSDYYASKGDYKNAVTSFVVFFRQHLIQHDSLAKEDMEYYEKVSHNEDLKKAKVIMEKRNLEMELSNSQLQLTNSDMELGQIRDRERIAKLDTENDNLTYQNRKQEVQKLRTAFKYQKIKNEAFKQMGLSYRMTTLMIYIVLLLIVVIIAVSSVRTYNAACKLKKANDELDKKNQQLTVARDEAEEADRMKTVFLQNMTHEIRTPLNAIMGFSTLLANGLESNEEDKAMMDEAIKTNSTMLETLIDDIVGFAELEGHFSVNLGTFNIIELCQDALAAVGNRLPTKVPLILDTSDVAPSMTCVTDGPRVQRVLVNLLTNAIKNTREGSIRLSVSLLSAAGMVTFSVADTGIGVPPEHAEEIFERFKKIDEFKQGTGLGLSICRLIATKLDGSIWLDTNYHPGARFVFQIPVFNENTQT